MTNKRKVQRFRTMQAKNSKERMHAEIRKIVKDNRQFFFDPITCTCLFLSKRAFLRLKGFANALSCMHESFDEYKERVKKELESS